jgi:alkyl hydroperoxide reductase subunit D
MPALEELRQTLGEPARDLRLNIQSVLEGTSLTPAQKWGVAVASAIATRNPELRRAVVGDAAAEVEPTVLDDARAAAGLMAMNNVYYRFRHMVGKPSYSTKSPRLRMNWMARPLTSKPDFELFSMAVSAINGCESCIASHEKAVLEGGIGEEQVHDAVRIAAAMAGMAIALESRMD